MAPPSKNQKEIEEKEKRARSYAYPRNWPGWGQESPAAQAEEPSRPAPANVSGNARANTSGNAPAKTSGNRSGNAVRNLASNANQGNRAAAADLWRSQVGQHPQQRPATQPNAHAQQQGGPSSTSGNCRARQDAPTGTVYPSNELVVRPDTTVARSDQRQERPFHAMDVISSGKSQNSDVHPEVKKRLGFSENYQGDVLNPNNRSDRIREEDSTSLYFYNLHPSMTVKELLDALVPLGPFGKVQQSNVKPPDPKNGYHYCGAKVAMFHRPQAEMLKKAIENKENPLYIRGIKVFVRWNTQKVDDFGKKHVGKMYMSRALEIRGPKYLVNIEGLYEYFKSKFLFDLQDVILVYEDDAIRHLRWVFASVLAQSEMAFLSLKESKYKEVQFKYGPDPLNIPQREVEHWISQAHLLPALGNFERTNAHPNLPPNNALAALLPPLPRLGDQNEHVAHNNTDEWDQYEEEIRQNIYDAESDEEDGPHFDHEDQKDQSFNPFAKRRFH